MSVIDGEEGCGLWLAESFEAIGFESGHVEDGNMFLGTEGADLGVIGGGLRAFAGGHVALDTGLAGRVGCPEIADGKGEQDGRCAVGAGVGDVLTEVPAIGMDGLGLALKRAGALGDVLRLFAETGQGAARLAAAKIASVVMPQLEKDEVARFELFLDGVPGAFVEEGSRGAAGAGTVRDVDTGGIEERREVVAPAEV